MIPNQAHQNSAKKAGIKNDFATAVRKCRHQLGISQEQLAERAGLHRTYVSDIERGARNLSLESITKLASALNVSISSLFSSGDGMADQSPVRFVANVPGHFVDILLVEDDPNDMELALEAFKQARFANCVHAVRDGKSALDYVARRGEYAQQGRTDWPHIVLLDLKLPDIHGLEVLRLMKQSKTTKTIPVVVLTASQYDHDIAESQRLGAATYIVKPLDFQRLSQITPQLKLNWALLRSEARAQA